MNILQTYRDLRIEGDYKLDPVLAEYSNSKRNIKIKDDDAMNDSVSYNVDFLINYVNQQNGTMTWKYLGYDLVFTVCGANLLIEVDGNVIIEIGPDCPLAFVAERISTFTMSKSRSEDDKVQDMIWITNEIISSINTYPPFIGH